MQFVRTAQFKHKHLLALSTEDAEPRLVATSYAVRAYGSIETQNTSSHSRTGGLTSQPLRMQLVRTFFFFFSFISLIADGPHHYHPACGHKGSSHLSPVHALHFFYRDASSALLQLVNQWLNFTYSRSHAFRYERKNTNPTLVRIELTTSVLADVQLTY